MHARTSLLLALAAASLLAGCPKKTPLTPPPPPMRPTAIPEPVAPAATRTDCDLPSLGAAEQPLTYAERLPRMQEAQALANDGTSKLRSAEGVGLDPRTREEMITEAVDTLISALAADPYNVHATYNLAAAYARIGRNQCALNLLDRIISMREHHSRKVEIADKLDRLLGRNGKQLDPDFRDLRQNDTFGCLINNIGTTSPKNCFAAAP